MGKQCIRRNLLNSAISIFADDDPSVIEDYDEIDRRCFFVGLERKESVEGEDSEWSVHVVVEVVGIIR